MIEIRKANDRGHADHGWLKSYHTFSFADYHDLRHMGFRSLRVINDDRVAPGQGFGTHPHRDMEIISYVLSGALEHKDSMGNGRVIHPGEFQYMAAGTGILHSEFNPLPDRPAHFLQIWILPAQRGVKPHYAEKSVNEEGDGRLSLIASPTGRDESIAINQDAELWLAKLDPSDTAEHALAPERYAWLHVAEGAVDINGHSLVSGDGVAVSGESQVRIKAESTSQVLVFDLN